MLCLFEFFDCRKAYFLFYKESYLYKTDHSALFCHEILNWMTINFDWMLSLKVLMHLFNMKKILIELYPLQYNSFMDNSYIQRVEWIFFISVSKEWRVLTEIMCIVYRNWFVEYSNWEIIDFKRCFFLILPTSFRI